MKTIIISIENILGSLSVHIIELDILGKIKTICVPVINSPNKIKKIRQYLEKKDFGGLAVWFKNEYSLSHSKLTVSLGPELYHWLNDKEKAKEYNNYYTNKKEKK